MQHVQVIRVGRKRKQDVERYPCGKIIFENPEAVLAVGLNQRLKQGIPLEDAVVRDDRSGKITAMNALAGHVLGRLRQLGQECGGISPRQYDAGMDYAHLIRRYAVIKGIPMGSPKSPTFDNVSTGLSLRPEPEQEHIDRTIGKYNDCQNVLSEVGRMHGNRLAKVVNGVCLERIGWEDLQADINGVALLRLGLNAVARILR